MHLSAIYLFWYSDIFSVHLHFDKTKLYFQYFLNYYDFSSMHNLKSTDYSHGSTSTSVNWVLIGWDYIFLTLFNNTYTWWNVTYCQRDTHEQISVNCTSLIYFISWKQIRLCLLQVVGHFIGTLMYLSTEPSWTHITLWIVLHILCPGVVDPNLQCIAIKHIYAME